MSLRIIILNIVITIDIGITIGMFRKNSVFPLNTFNYNTVSYCTIYCSMLITQDDLSIQRSDSTNCTETGVSIDNNFDHSKTESEKYSEEKQMTK